MIDYTLDYAYLSFILSVAIFLLAFPVAWLLRETERVPPLLGWSLILLTLAGVVGAWGRYSEIEFDPAGDRWVRIILVSLRIAVVLALALDARWLWYRLRRQEVHR